MKYKIEAADIGDAVLQLTARYLRDKSQPKTVKIVCTDFRREPPYAVRVTVERLQEPQVMRAIASADRAAEQRKKRKLREAAAAKKKAAKKKDGAKS